MSIVWRDKVLSSYNGNIESVIVHDADGTNEIEVPNGVFVKLGDTLGREVKKGLLADTHTGELLLVASPEVNYDGKAELDDFVNEKGSVARAFRLADGDVITLTVDLIKGAPAVGDKLVVGTGGKLTKTTIANEDEEAKIHFVVREDAKHELTRKQKALRLDVVRK